MFRRLSNRQLQAESLARPLRVAYMVDAKKTPPELLDAIFAECYGRWGGRWSLIVPCDGGKPKTDYLPWLEKWDPDLIYSYVPLSFDDQAFLHESLYPSSIVIHEIYDEDSDRKWHPNLKCTAVSSLTVLPWIAARPNAFDRGSAELLDVYWSEPHPARWIRDSFGLPRISEGTTAIVEAASSCIPANTLISQENLDNKTLVKSNSAKYAVGQSDWLMRFANNRSAISLADAASFISQRLNISHAHNRRALSLVVGDSFDDRLMFWNSFHYNGINWPGIYSLRVDPLEFEQEENLELLSALVLNRNRHWDQGRHSTAVRSCSIDAEQLAEYADKLKASMKFHYVRSEPIESADHTIPDLEPKFFGGGYFHEWTHQIERPVETVRFIGDLVHCAKPVPPQFQEISQVPLPLRSGAWMLDIQLDRSANYSQYSNVDHWWALPRRLRLAYSFIERGSVSTRPDDSFLRLLPRVSSSGKLSVASSLSGNVPQLRIPRDDDLLRHALIQPHDWIGHNALQEQAQISSIWTGYADTETSDKGRYLVGTMNLLGGLENAFDILLEPFWQTLFGKLGTDNGQHRDAVVEKLLGKLKKKEQFKKFPISLEDEEALRLFLDDSWAGIRTTDRSTQSLSFSKIMELWLNTQKEDLSHLDEEENQEWHKWERVSFINKLESLSEKQVLHQGHEWQCLRCLNRNWLAISNLSRTWHCEVCGYAKPADIEKEWRFRLNGFLKTALTDHGMLATIWCLRTLRDRSDSGFYFLPSTNLYTERQMSKRGSTTAEFDLLAVVDGETYLCEIKSSARISKKELAAFATVANNVRPDKALLAIYVCDQKKLDKVQNDLSKLLTKGISAEIISHRTE